MKNRLGSWFAGVLVALAAVLAASQAEAKTFYWISHGSPADPVWTYFLAGANQWAEDTGNTVNTSFHNGDVAAHQEAVRAAIAAKARTGSPRPRAPIRAVWSRSPSEAVDGAKHPDHQLQHPRSRPLAVRRLRRRRQLVTFGRSNWAQYLVDHEAGEGGRLRLDAGRDPRRHLRRAGGGREFQVGASSRSGITYEVTEATRSTRARSSPG